MEIRNIEVFGIDRAIKSSGLPFVVDFEEFEKTAINSNDMKRAKKLSKTAGNSGHCNFLNGITVMFDLKYEQYFTPQLQRYHWVDIVSSQSKMHKLTNSELSVSNCNMYVLDSIADKINLYIESYNDYDDFPVKFLMSHYGTKYPVESKQDLFYYIISNLPMGFQLWMDVKTNYLQLKNIYNQRKGHKLVHEWGVFCDMIENLPHSYLITGGEK